MNKFWEKFFYLFTFVTQGSSYLSAHVYGALHRMHHAYTDTEKDPHSPRYDANMFSMMWRTKKIYNGILRQKTKIEAQFFNNLPSWKSFDTFADHKVTRIAWGLGYIVFYAFFATHWWMYLLLPIHFLMGPVHGVIINWFAHKIGTRNFKEEDNDSRNLLPVDVLMFGEGYHNNHHHLPNRPNFGVKWYEIDFAYPIILLLDKLNIIRLNRARA